MTSLTVENYLKAIYQLGGHQDPSVSTGALANELGVSPSTATSMIKTLHENGWAEHRPYEGVQLTGKGRRLALRVLRRHRLIELFLVKTLKLTWDEVHDEAEHMEHAVSDLLVDRIDAFLGYPALDPHGDPIPRSDGSMTSSHQIPLSECAVGNPWVLERVIDQKPEFLRFLTDSGLHIGTCVRIVAEDKPADTITLDVAGETVTLGRQASQLLLMGIPQETGR